MGPPNESSKANRLGRGAADKTRRNLAKQEFEG